MPTLRQLQRAAFWMAVACALLGWLTATGCGPLPEGGNRWLVVLHPLLLIVGGLFGAVTVLSHREIERQRWEILDEPALTKGEREWAHKEAESQRARAAGTFLAATLLLALWLSYQFRGEGRTLAGDLLAVTALVGFGLGLLAGLWRWREPRR